MQGWLGFDKMGFADVQVKGKKIDMKKPVFNEVDYEKVFLFSGGDRTILLVDVGAKDKIVLSLIARGRL